MNSEAFPPDSPSQELLKARKIMAQQAQEIERLQQRLQDERFVEDLRRNLSLTAMAGTIASPVSHRRLLEMIVEVAAQVISARAAALFLIDQQSQEMVFEVALGQKASEVKKFRVPLGHGIAGLVAITGQPMATSNAQHDSRQASDIAQAVGYQPQSILCVPLFYNEQVIGVLELLDKEGATSFSTTDMQTLGLFANQAAVAIEQSRTHRSLRALLTEVLGSLDGGARYQKEKLEQGLSGFAAHLEEGISYQQAFDLAQLVQEIVWQGEDEAKACHSILQSFAQYLRSRPQFRDYQGGGF